MFPVRTHEFQASVLQACRSRKDKWSDAVYGRIAFVNDLHAADAIYHQQCIPGRGRIFPINYLLTLQTQQKGSNVEDMRPREQQHSWKSHNS